MDSDPEYNPDSNDIDKVARRGCLNMIQKQLDPTDYGWMTDDSGCLDIEWMTCKPAPDEVLELLLQNCDILVAQEEHDDFEDDYISEDEDE